MLNHYSIFAPHSRCHMSFSSASYLFWKMIYWSDNTGLLSLPRFVYNAFIALGTDFGVLTPKFLRQCSVMQIKCQIMLV